MFSVDAFEDAGVECAIRGAVCDAVEEIVRAAEAVDADRMFVGGRSRIPTGKAFLGSVAQSVMLSAPCLVTFVRRESDARGHDTGYFHARLV